MSNGTEQYELYLAASKADQEELDEQQRKLRRELNDVNGVTAITQISAGTAPENARAIELAVIGGLAVTLKQAGVFAAVVAVLKTWIESGNRRKEKRKVVIKCPDGTVKEFDGYSLKEIGDFSTSASTAEDKT